MARATMVESQLRTDRVTDRRILSAFAMLPRERFVPEETRARLSRCEPRGLAVDAGAPARFLFRPWCSPAYPTRRSRQNMPCSMSAAPPAIQPPRRRISPVRSPR